MIFFFVIWKFFPHDLLIVVGFTMVSTNISFFQNISLLFYRKFIEKLIAWKNCQILKVSKKSYVHKMLLNKVQNKQFHCIVP